MFKVHFKHVHVWNSINRTLNLSLLLKQGPMSLPRALLTESHYDAPLPLWRHNEDHVILAICHGDRSTQRLRFSLVVERAGRKLCLLTIPRDWSLISNWYLFILITMFHVSSSQPRWCEEEDWFTQKLLTIRVAAPKHLSALEQVSEDTGTTPHRRHATSHNLDATLS